MKAKKIVSGMLKESKLLFQEILKDYIFDAEEVIISPEPVQSVMEVSKEPEFANQAVKDFFENFIGVLITGFVPYQKHVDNLSTSIQAKMITQVKIDGKDFWLQLAKINNHPGGYLKISPTVHGQFSETELKENHDHHSVFRIIFLGNDTLEYIDPNHKGTITYHSNYQGK